MQLRPILLNSLVFINEISGCGFESRCCHLDFRDDAYFKQVVPLHSGIL